MTMTVAKMHKLLSDLVKRGHGRKPVCIDKRSFHHPLEQDGAVILGVTEIYGPKFIPSTDDDGGSKINTDGSESGRMTVVLSGGWHETD